RAVAARLDVLRDQYQDEQIAAAFHALSDLPELRALADRVPRALAERAVSEIAAATPDRIAERLGSSEAGLLADLVPMARPSSRAADLLAVRLGDALLERGELAEFSSAVERFLD